MTYTTKEEALEAVKQNGLNIQYASKELQEDKELVLLAVSQQERLLEVLPNHWKADKDVMKVAIKKHHEAFIHADKTLQEDKGYVLELAKANPWLIKILFYNRYKLHHDKEILLTCLQGFEPDSNDYHRAKNYLPDELKEEIGDGDPLKYLQSQFLHRDLQAELTRKEEQKHTTKEVKL